MSHLSCLWSSVLLRRGRYIIQVHCYDVFMLRINGWFHRTKMRKRHHIYLQTDSSNKINQSGVHHVLVCEIILSGLPEMKCALYTRIKWPAGADGDHKVTLEHLLVFGPFLFWPDKNNFYIFLWLIEFIPAVEPQVIFAKS